jgi:hypothetical protein
MQVYMALVTAKIVAKATPAVPLFDPGKQVVGLDRCPFFFSGLFGRSL